LGCFVHPGSGLSTITTSAGSDIQTLSKQDVVVVWGGSRNVGKNETKRGINRVKNFVETNKHTNIILMEVPHRHDLIQHSCVNKEVGKFNSIMKKHMKAHENTEVIKVNLDRGAFTKHGQHMNATGKELMAKRITEAIKHTLTASKKTPIIMAWKEGTSKDKQDPWKDAPGNREERDPIQHGKDSAQTEEGDNNQQETEIGGTVPTRNRRVPVTRSEDFLRTATNKRQAR
jgi:hypothetical protein